MDGLSTVRLAALAIPVAAALGVLAWRLRETQRAVTLRSIARWSKTLRTAHFHPVCVFDALA